MLKNMARTKNFFGCFRTWCDLFWNDFVVKRPVTICRLWGAILFWCYQQKEAKRGFLNFVFLTVIWEWLHISSYKQVWYIRLVWEIFHILWSIVTCLGSWTILLVMCSTFSESFTSIPKYVYLSYTKTLKHCFVVTNDVETKLTFRPQLLDDKTWALRSVHTRRQVAATRCGDRSLRVHRLGD